MSRPPGLPAPRPTGTALAVVPVQLQEVAEAAGQAAALALVEAVGGSRIWIPLHPTPWLVDAVGAEAAEKLCAHYRVTNADGREVGNVTLYVPLAGTSARDVARQKVRDYVAAGLSVREAARRAKVTERTAQRALGRTLDSRQEELPF